jgi:Flp pilus assembly protein TadD
MLFMFRRISLFTVGFALLFVWANASSAQTRTSPQDAYLQIYLAIQDAERAENGGQKASARGRYQSSLGELRELKKTNPDWEPTIVNYRIKFLEDKVASLEGEKDANPVVAESKTPEPPPVAVVETVVEEVVEEVGSKAPASEPEATAMVAEVEAPTPADPTPERASPPPAPTPDPEPVASVAVTPPTAEPTAETAKLQARISELEDELAETKGKLAQAEAEATKLRQQVASLEAQLTESKKSAQSGADQMNTVLEENKSLKAKLAETEAEVAKLKTGEKGSVANLEVQLKKARDQLTMTKNENEALLKANEEFRKNLQEVQQELAETGKRLADAAKQAPSAAASNPALQKENDLLKSIVDRQLKEQARRDAAKRVALEEIQRLNVQSETLTTQLQILGSPLINLTDEELALLKVTKPELQIDESGTTISADINKVANIDKRPRVPEEFREVANEAQKLFAAQRFDEAAAKYQVILNAHPNSLYALSNVAVVRFQQGNYAEAEKFLRRSVEQSPQDAFSHSILGIVLYQQGKYDEAVTVLTRAVALDPKDPKTRNYLGISASQKGMQESAEQQCRKAIELDETYGDAHFNLAVIYATQSPPSKELARRHYRRALELGVPRDNSLEDMIK